MISNRIETFILPNADSSSLLTLWRNGSLHTVVQWLHQHVANPVQDFVNFVLFLEFRFKSESYLWLLSDTLVEIYKMIVNSMSTFIKNKEYIMPQYKNIQNARHSTKTYSLPRVKTDDSQKNLECCANHFSCAQAVESLSAHIPLESTLI